MCLANIVEGKDEALQCEGACQQWFHRYCAGVSQSHFKTLTTSDSPFVCLYCSRDLRQAALNQLQDEVRALKTEVGELLAACDLEVVRGIASKRDLLTALIEEVQQLKVQCESARAQPELVDRTTHCVSSQSFPSTSGNSAWQVGTSKESKHMSSRSSQRHSTLVSHPKSYSRHYVKVEGARKVWGTMRNTSASAVANTIKFLTTLSASQNDLIRGNIREHTMTRSVW